MFMINIYNVQKRFVTVDQRSSTLLFVLVTKLFLTLQGLCNRVCISNIAILEKEMAYTVTEEPLTVVQSLT